jgi:hypothetical protein
VFQLLVTANVPSSAILVNLVIEVILPPKRRFLQESHGVTSQKMAIFMVRLFIRFEVVGLVTGAHSDMGRNGLTLPFGYRHM